LDDKAGPFLGSWVENRRTLRHHVHRLPDAHRRHCVHPFPHPECPQSAVEAECVVPGRPVPGLPLQNRPRAEGAVSLQGITGLRL